MKHIILLVTVTICLLLLVLPNPTFSAQEKRIALVIGNGAYKSVPLRNPVNDATDIAIALEKTGFIVMKSVNATRKQMRRAIRSFGEEINKGAVGLFYYAGHGIQVAGENYLVPIGAEVSSEDEVEDECLKVSSVLRKMETAGNRLNIIILDACRDNPFARSFRSSSRGLAKMDAPTGSILAYATAPGSIASDGPGRNGLYTSAFLKHMMTPGLEIGKLFRQVRIDVVGASGKKQVPWEASSLMGDFYFNTYRGIRIVDKPKTKQTKFPKDAVDKELAFWKSIQTSDDPDEYGAYLSEFPNGKFVSLAYIKINRLKQKKVTPSAILEAAKTEKPKKNTIVASISPDVTKPKIVAPDTHYEKYANGIVKDTRTGLEWYAGPDQGTNLNEAKRWVANLDVAGGGWRMPTRKELKSLYIKGAGSRNMTSLLRTAGWRVWSGETAGLGSNWTFYFYGGSETWYGSNDSYDVRGFAVRSQKKAYDFDTNVYDR